MNKKYGVISDSYYHGGYWSNLDRTLVDTQQHDIREIYAVWYNLRYKRPFRVLLAGCAVVYSVVALAEVLPPGTELVVVDSNQKNVDRLRQEYDCSYYQVKSVQISWICADLFTLTPAQVGSFAYIRMDYTQDFIDPQRQVELLITLKKLLSNQGRIASVAAISNIGDAPVIEESTVSITVRFPVGMLIGFIRDAGMHLYGNEKVYHYEEILINPYGDNEDTERLATWNANFLIAG